MVLNNKHCVVIVVVIGEIIISKNNSKGDRLLKFGGPTWAEFKKSKIGACRPLVYIFNHMISPKFCENIMMK